MNSPSRLMSQLNDSYVVVILMFAPKPVNYILYFNLTVGFVCILHLSRGTALKKRAIFNICLPICANTLTISSTGSRLVVILGN